MTSAVITLTSKAQTHPSFAAGVVLAGDFLDAIQQRLQETGASLGDTPTWLEAWLDDLEGEVRRGFLASISTFVALAASGAVTVPGESLIDEMLGTQSENKASDHCLLLSGNRAPYCLMRSQGHGN